MKTWAGFGRRTDRSDQREQENQRIRSVIETALDAFVMVDQDGRVTEWNKQAEALFGWTRAEAMGGAMSEMIIPLEHRDTHYQGMETYLTGGEHVILNQRIEITALNRAGDIFPIELSVTPHHVNGRVFFTSFMRDITQRLATEQALIETRNKAEEDNLAKTEFLANMSHEIRTPMNAVIGLSNILARSEPLTQKQKDFIRTLQMSADSLLALINDLLDIAKIEARTVDLEKIPFNLTQILQEVISLLAVRMREKGLDFTTDGECVEKRSFVGDPNRLRQIILNLCSNAIKFTHQGGVHVAITCEATDAADVENIHIVVRDTGIGIPAGQLGVIFQKFVQADSSVSRKYGGTGLGLAITKNLTEIMGGTIHVDSVVGQGSTFTVTIPMRVAEQDGEDDTPHEANDNHRNADDVMPHVLLVEDHPPNILVASTYLGQFGYRVSLAGNGVEALENVKATRFALVLMDVQMPGMNGLDATRLIRAHEQQQGLTPVPILGMTAHALAGDRERCIGAGMDDYLPKPFNPNELKTKLHDMIHGKQDTA